MLKRSGFPMHAIDLMLGFIICGFPKDKHVLLQLEHALRNDFSGAKIRMRFHAEGHGPELLAVDEDLDDDGRPRRTRMIMTTWTVTAAMRRSIYLRFQI